VIGAAASAAPSLVLRLPDAACQGSSAAGFGGSVDRFSSPKSLNEFLLTARNKRIAEGEFALEDVVYIRSLSLSPIKGDLNISDEALERLRRLCQLWQVRLRPRVISSHRPIIGRLVVLTKRALFPVVAFFMRDALRQQREFNAATIRLMAQLISEFQSGHSRKEASHISE
jgi:hypothetical protein